jgi:hypothetical protein
LRTSSLGLQAEKTVGTAAIACGKVAMDIIRDSIPPAYRLGRDLNLEPGGCLQFHSCQAGDQPYPPDGREVLESAAEINDQSHGSVNLYLTREFGSLLTTCAYPVIWPIS